MAVCQGCQSTHDVQKKSTCTLDKTQTASCKPVHWLQGTVFMHSSARASGSVPNSDTESPMVPSETGEQQEGAKRQGEFSDVDEADMEKAGSGQMEKNKERVQQAGSGGKEATTSLPGKQEQGQRDQSGVQDDNAQKQASPPLKRHGHRNYI